MNTQTIGRYAYAGLTSPTARSFYRTTAIVVDDTITTTARLLTDTAIGIYNTATCPTAIRFYRYTYHRATADTTRLIDTALDVVDTLVLVSQFLLSWLKQLDHEEVEEYQTALPYASTPKALLSAPGPIALLPPAPPDESKDDQTAEAISQPQPQQEQPTTSEPWLSLWPKPGTNPTPKPFLPYHTRPYEYHRRNASRCTIDSPLKAIKEEVRQKLTDEQVRKWGPLTKRTTWFLAMSHLHTMHLSIR